MCPLAEPLLLIFSFIAFLCAYVFQLLFLLFLFTALLCTYVFQLFERLTIQSIITLITAAKKHHTLVKNSR